MKWENYFGPIPTLDPTETEVRSLPNTRFFEKLDEQTNERATERATGRGIPCSFTYAEPCGKEAMCEVWGLAFCHSHGADAGALALSEEASFVSDYMRALVSGFEEMHPESQAVGEVLKRAQRETLKASTSSVARKLPVRYPPECLEGWAREYFENPPVNTRDCYQIHPEDYAHDLLYDALRAMRGAFSSRSEEMVRAIEPVRQKARAQMKVAERYMAVNCEAIHRAYERKSQEKEES